MDNCSIHKKDEFNYKDLCIKNNIELFLPPYSPELKPIGNICSIVKNNIRKLLATTYQKQLIDTGNNCLSRVCNAGYDRIVLYSPKPHSSSENTPTDLFLCSTRYMDCIFSVGVIGELRFFLMTGLIIFHPTRPIVRSL